MEKYDVYKVFTPTTTAKLTFIDREAVNTKLVNAIRTPGKQIIVYGHSGSGKTTLLVNKLFQLYENHLTSRCMMGETFESLLLDAFDQLSPFYITEEVRSENSTITTQLSQDYLAIKSQINGSISNGTAIKKQRLLPPQLTAQALGRFMGASKCCWVLEDFHKIDESERAKLSQIMKVFKDMADDYPTLKIIAIGAVDTARQIVEYDLEMKNRVAEIHVPLMNDNEIKQIIQKGTELLNITISEDIKKVISQYCNGIASVCHHLCLNMCTVEEIYETQDYKSILDIETLEEALKVYLEESSDTVKKVFDNAFNKQKRVQTYNNPKLIIHALSKVPQEGAISSVLFESIKKHHPKYPQSNLSKFLNKLCEGNNPIIYHVALAYFKKTNSAKTIDLVMLDAINMLRNRIIENARKEILITKKSSLSLPKLNYTFGKDKKED